MKRFSSTVLPLAILIFSISNALGQAGVTGRNVKSVEYSSGFGTTKGKFTETAPGKWGEWMSNGETHNYKEVNRDDLFVYLSDSARKILMRLDLYNKGVIITSEQGNDRLLYKIVKAELYSNVIPHEAIVTVYEDEDFHGRSAKLTTDVAWVGFDWDHRISSIRVKEGYKLIAFDDAMFKGGRVDISGGWTAAGAFKSWNNKVAAFRIEKTTSSSSSNRAIVTLYEDLDFKGKSVATNTDLGWFGTDWMNRVSSVRVQDGYRLTAYPKNNFEGQAITIGGSWSASGLNSAWNDKLSSLRLVKISNTPPLPANILTVYLDDNFQGRPLTYDQGPAYFVGEDRNDQFSSMRVHPGYKVVAFRDGYFKGDSIEISGDWDAAKSAPGWNNQISSFKLIDEVNILPTIIGPTDYYLCTGDNGTFSSYDKKIDIAYGANGKFVYKYGVIGRLEFNVSTFEDPIPGVTKYGFYKFSEPVPVKQAAAAVNGMSAVYVEHANGKFSLNESGDWVETRFNNSKYYFKEIRRDEWSIYLYDDSRKMSVRIDLFTKAIYFSRLNKPEAKLYDVVKSLDVPEGYTKCATENETYTPSGTVDVAYGANGKFKYHHTVTGPIKFDNSTFGDPAPGFSKYGYVKMQ